MVVVMVATTTQPSHYHKQPAAASALAREYPKKQILKEVTAYNPVFYPESRSLLSRYS